MKLLLKILLRIGMIFAAFVVLTGIAVFFARCLNRSKTKISAEKGIQENIFVELGGIKQHLQIRGKNRENPIIIFLHGGPGNAMAYTSYFHQSELEGEFTFINWDQRGCGRTYWNNTNLNINTELSTEILINDVNELVDYATERFQQEKVIIMGHSWGTLLGSKYITEHPEKVSHYIGIGQVISLKQGYVYSAKEAALKAQEKGNLKDVNVLKASIDIFNNTTDLENFNSDNFVQMQQYSAKYLTYIGQISTPEMLWIMITSPEITFSDVKWFFKSNNIDTLQALQRPLMQDCFFNLNVNDFGHEYKIPVSYITGECDINTPIQLTKQFFENVKAPQKELIQIDNTGHIPFMDNPKEFVSVVKEILRNEIN